MLGRRSLRFVLGIALIGSALGVVWQPNQVSSAPILVRSDAVTNRYFDIDASSDGLVAYAVTAPLSYIGKVSKSTDGGVSWSVLSASPAGNWESVSTSGDGSIVAITGTVDGTATGYALYVSTDAGVTWSREGTNSEAYDDVAVSADGDTIVVARRSSGVQTSTDLGDTWTSRSRGARNVAVNTDGTVVVASEFGGKVWRSSDSGATWAELAGQSSTENWQDVAVSDDGDTIFGVVFNGTGHIWTVAAGTSTWYSTGPLGFASGQAVRGAVSPDGNTFIAGSYGVQPRLLRNWDRTTNPSTLTWVAQASGTSVLGLSITNAGSRFLVATEGDGIWTYVPAAPAPVVDTAERADCGGLLFGPAKGGTIVQIEGRYLFDATVTVGGVAATVTYVSSDGTLLRFNTPVGLPGSATVVISTGSGSVTLADRFEYLAAPRGWEMVGSTIRGSDSSAWGESIDLSADGQVLVMSSPYADGAVPQAGSARVYVRTGSGWVQRGSDIVGGETDEEFGSSVAISSDGGTVAVGAREFSGIGSDDRIGAVRVYQWSGGTWALVGTEIRGSLGDTAFFGRSVALSSDGETLAVGADGADAVHVYRFAGGAWVQLGGVLTGGVGESFGWSVALSADGETVAVGAYGADAARVYRFAGGVWGQLGSDLTGGVGDVFGWAVALSSDGETLVVGAPEFIGTNEDGVVRVFDFDGTTWTQRGADMRGGDEEYAGAAVAVSADGDVVGYTMPYRCDYEFTGTVAVREWNGSTWAMRGDPIQATTDGIGFGLALAMNVSGNTVAVSDIYGLDSDGAVTVWSQPTTATAAVAAAPASMPTVEPEQSPLEVVPITELPETGKGMPAPAALVMLFAGAMMVRSGARRRLRS
jgi:hypothetical protein